MYFEAAMIASSTYNTTVIQADEISKDIQLGFGIYLIIALIIGVVGNIMTMCIIVLNTHLQTAPNCFIFNLAVADVSLLLVNLPTTINNFLSKEASRDYSYCKLTSPINIVTMLAALHSAGAVAYNRYLFLCKPKVVYRRYSTKKWIAATIATIWIWCFLISSPPLFGFGEYGYHSKFHTCFFIAYDYHSYLFGTIFCCCIGVFPVAIATMFFFKQIFAKIRRTTKSLEDAEKRSQLKEQLVQMGETLAYAFSNGPYGEQELSVSSTNQCSTCDDYWTPQHGKKNRSIHPETSMLFEKNCSKINAASDCLFGAAVSHNLELARMDVDAINTMKSKADATASRAIRSKNRLVAQPEGRNVQPVDVLNIQRALLNKKSPTLYHSFKFGQERKSLSLPPPSHESGKRESTAKSASGRGSDGEPRSGNRYVFGAKDTSSNKMTDKNLRAIAEALRNSFSTEKHLINDSAPVETTSIMREGMRTMKANSAQPRAPETTQTITRKGKKTPTTELKDKISAWKGIPEQTTVSPIKPGNLNRTANAKIDLSPPKHDGRDTRQSYTGIVDNSMLSERIANKMSDGLANESRMGKSTTCILNLSNGRDVLCGVKSTQRGIASRDTQYFSPKICGTNNPGVFMNKRRAKIHREGGERPLHSYDVGSRQLELYPVVDYHKHVIPLGSRYALTQAGTSMLQESLNYLLSDTKGIRHRTVAQSTLSRRSSAQIMQSHSGANNKVTMRSGKPFKEDLQISYTNSVADSTQSMNDRLPSLPQLEEYIIHCDIDVLAEDISRQSGNSVTIHQEPETNPEHQCNNSAITEISESKLDCRLVKHMLWEFKADATRKQKRAILMLLLIFMIIICCWLPVTINFIIDKDNKFPSIFSVVFVVLAWTNSCVNIFVYGCMNRRFYVAYKVLLRCSRAQDDDLVDNTAMIKGFSRVIELHYDVKEQLEARKLNRAAANRESNRLRCQAAVDNQGQQESASDVI